MRASCEKCLEDHRKRPAEVAIKTTTHNGTVYYAACKKCAVKVYVPNFIAGDIRFQICPIE